MMWTVRLLVCRQVAGREVQVQVFTQSQCLGSYQCLAARLQGDRVQLQLGAATPNIEHSCVPPSFDPQLPLLLPVPLAPPRRARSPLRRLLQTLPGPPALHRLAGHTQGNALTTKCP